MSLLIEIIRQLLSLSINPKVITLSSFHCCSFEINCEKALFYFQIANIVTRAVGQVESNPELERLRKELSSVKASLGNEATTVKALLTDVSDKEATILQLQKEVSDKDEVIRCLQKEVEDLKLDPATRHKRRRMIPYPEVRYKLIFESRLLHFYNLDCLSS